MKLILSALLLTALIAGTAQAQTPSEESVRQLMRQTGAGEVGKQVLNQLMPALHQAVPDMPDKFWQELFAQIDEDALIDMIVPVYQKHLTQSDVDAANAFFGSAAGQKFANSQSAILGESMQLGTVWGRQIAERALAEANENN